MKEQAGPIYEFLGFRLDPARRLLLRNGLPVILGAKAFDALLLLVQNSGRVLEKDELLKAIWPGTFVEEGSLSQNISVLRKVLGDGKNGNSFIQTIPRRGYAFVAKVRKVEVATDTGEPKDSPLSAAAGLDELDLEQRLPEAAESSIAACDDASKGGLRRQRAVLNRFHLLILTGVLVVAAASMWLPRSIVAFFTSAAGWLPTASEYASMVLGLILTSRLLILVYRQGVRKQLPWFALYLFWAVLEECLQLVTRLISLRLYIELYWWMELVAIVLTVTAVRESFLRIFRSFSQRHWFRWLVSGAITAIAAFAGWKAIYHPPVQGSRVAFFVYGLEFLFRWGIAGVALLVTLLSYLVEPPPGRQEDAVVTGFGIVSLGFLVWVLNIWLFGMRYLFVSKYAPPVAYLTALFLWNWAFSRPIESNGFHDLGTAPEGLRKLLGRCRQGLQMVWGQPR